MDTQSGHNSIVHQATPVDQDEINRLNVKVIQNLLTHSRLSKERRAHLENLLVTTYGNEAL